MMPVSASKRETVTRCAVLPCSRWGFDGDDGALNRRAAARRSGVCGVAMRVLYRAERRVQCGLNYAATEFLAKNNDGGLEAGVTRGLSSAVYAVEAGVLMLGV